MTIRIRDLAEEESSSVNYLLECNPSLRGLTGDTILSPEQIEMVRRSGGPPFPTNAAIIELSIGGFKAYGSEQSVPLRPITLVFGPNSSGKSSLLHSLVWAHHAQSAGNFNAQQVEPSGEGVDLGDFNNVAFRHDDKTVIKFGFTLHPRLLEEALELRRSLHVSLDIGNQDIPIKEDHAARKRDRKSGKPRTERQPRLTRMELSCEGGQIFRAVYRAGEDRLEVDELDISHPVCRALIDDIANTGDRRLNKAVGLVAVTRQVVEALIRKATIKSTGFNLGFEDFSSYEVTTCRENLPIKSPALRRFARKDAAWAEFYDERIANFLNSIFQGTVGRVAHHLDTMRYLGPLRTYPERFFTFIAKQDRNWRGGGGECWDKLRKNEEHERELVNKFLREKLLHTPYEFRTRRYKAPDGASIDDLFLMDLRTKTPVNHRDVGVGISQIVPVLVQSLANAYKTIMIEQPELHIHPALQAELGDMFIESALGDNRNRFILETHSEHLILRLLRRIRQSTENAADYPKDLPRLSPDDVSVIYAKPTEKGTELKPLCITPDGKFEDDWPSGFFTERLKEVL